MKSRIGDVEEHELISVVHPVHGGVEMIESEGDELNTVE